MTASDMLMVQVNTLAAAIDVMNAAINDITGSTNPDTATWIGVARYPHLIDAIKRGEIIPQG